MSIENLLMCDLIKFKFILYVKTQSFTEWVPYLFILTQCRKSKNI